ISTSLPSISSSIYNGLNVLSSNFANSASTSMSTEGHSGTWSSTVTSKQQNNQLQSNYKTSPSFSNRSGFTTSSSSSLMTQNSQSSLNPYPPLMERSN